MLFLEIILHYFKKSIITSENEYKKTIKEWTRQGGYTTTPPNGVCVTCDKNTHFY